MTIDYPAWIIAWLICGMAGDAIGLFFLIRKYPGPLSRGEIIRAFLLMLIGPCNLVAVLIALVMEWRRK